MLPLVQFECSAPHRLTPHTVSNCPRRRQWRADGRVGAAGRASRRRLYCSFMAPHSAPRGVLSMAHTSSQRRLLVDARAPLAPSLAREGGLICECTTQCQLALRVHFAHGRVLIWRHCLLHGHVKTPFLHGALRKALRMGPPAAGAVLAFQLAWTTAVLLLACWLLVRS